MERNHRMELQYDGTGLHGWSKQEGLQTVEGCLGDAFRTVFGKAPTLRVAGRTDAGVHARRQVISLSLPAGVDLLKLRRSLNALTPPGIAVLSLTPAPAGFDARKNAATRRYRYFLSTQPVMSPFCSRYCWHLPLNLDLSLMEMAAGLTVGRHHFGAFTPTETEHVFFDRTVLRCSWTRVRGVAALGPVGLSGPLRPGGPVGPTGVAPGCPLPAAGLLWLEIEADAFLRHMVRTIVGTMVEVGQGERKLEDFRRLLDGAPREAAGPTAPAHGLFLWDVRYGRQSRTAGGGSAD